MCYNYWASIPGHIYNSTDPNFQSTCLTSTRLILSSRHGKILNLLSGLYIMSLLSLCSRVWVPQMLSNIWCALSFTSETNPKSGISQLLSLYCWVYAPEILNPCSYTLEAQLLGLPLKHFCCNYWTCTPLNESQNYGIAAVETNVLSLLNLHTDQVSLQ